MTGRLLRLLVRASVARPLLAVIAAVTLAAGGVAGPPIPAGGSATRSTIPRPPPAERHGPAPPRDRR